MGFVNPCVEREELGPRRFRDTIGLRPVAYPDAGTLRRIIPIWANSGIVGRPHIVTASQMMVSVGDDGFRRIHPTRDPLRYMEIGPPAVKVGGVWRSVGFASATRAANSITWHRPQADLRITHGGHFIKLDLELLGGYVPEGGLIAFPVGLTGLTRTGAQIKADGETVALLRAPTVSDAANLEGDTRPITYDFVNIGGQPYLVMTLPSLAGMARPVIDPTLTLQPDATDGQDTGILSEEPTWNCGSRSLVWLRVIRKALMRFVLSGIPSGATCTSANLSITSTSISDISRTIYAYHILAANGDWIEGTGWNIQALAGEPCWDAKVADGAGGITTAWAGSAGLETAGTDYDSIALGSTTWLSTDPDNTVYTISLTPATVKTWFGLATNNGMLLFCSAYGDDPSIAMSDDATAAYRPKLVVEYTLPGGGARRIFIPDLGYLHTRGA